MSVNQKRIRGSQRQTASGKSISGKFLDKKQKTELLFCMSHTHLFLEVKIFLIIAGLCLIAVYPLAETCPIGQAPSLPLLT